MSALSQQVTPRYQQTGVHKSIIKQDRNDINNPHRLETVSKKIYWRAFSVSDSWLWCFRGWCVAVGERVQHERDVRHNGLSTGRDGHIRAHCWGWGSDGASVLWLLRNNETRKICSWICKYPEQLVRRSF